MAFCRSYDSHVPPRFKLSAVTEFSPKSGTKQPKQGKFKKVELVAIAGAGNVSNQFFYQIANRQFQPLRFRGSNRSRTPLSLIITCNSAWHAFDDIFRAGYCVLMHTVTKESVVKCRVISWEVNTK
jgi:hypothetical protein